MAKKQTHFDATLSVKVELIMWYKLEAYSRLKGANGKSLVVRAALTDYFRSVENSMPIDEREQFYRILENIKSPSLIEGAE